MNVTELYFLVGIFVGGVWGFSVGHQHGPLYGLLGGIVGVTVGLAGAAAVVVSWVVLMSLWDRSKLHNHLPEAASGSIVVALALLALAGVPLVLVWLIRTALRAAGFTGVT